MKRIFIFFSVLTAIVILGTSSTSSVQNSGAAPAGRTGATGSYCNVCHSGNALNTAGGSVVASGLPTAYSLGSAYSFSVTITHAASDRKRWGFAIKAVDANGTGIGTFTTTNSNASVANNELKHLNAPATTSTNTYTFNNLKWTANNTNSLGNKVVKFYLVAVAADGSNTTGDFVYSNLTTVPIATTITSFTPTKTGAGSSVAIKGYSFTGATAVSFGGTVAASFTASTDSTIAAVVGSGASGTVSVTSPNGTATLAGFSFCTVTPTTQSVNLVGCNSLVYNGTTYTTSTIKKDTIRTSQGCDSIYKTANITIKTISPTSSNKFFSACGSLVYSGVTYTTSTTKKDTIRTAQGCDSIYKTANITIYPNSTTTQTTNLSGCSKVVYNGTTYTSSTILKDTVKSTYGCDSVYRVVNITIKTIVPTTQSVNLSGCNSLVYNGTTYTSSTTKKDTIKNQQGCDSVYNTVNINIKTLVPISQANNIVGCNMVTYKGITYTTSSVVKDTLKTLQGCDSIYLTNTLTVNPNISGNIIHPTKGAIQKVNLLVTGSTTSSSLSNGNYTASCLPANASGAIKLAKNNDAAKSNGVSAIDAILIQNHILGKIKLNSPYKIIAADVNSNKSVSSIDVIFLKRLVLGLDTTFTGNKLWSFVDSAYHFPDTTNPFPFKDSISFSNLTSSKINQTFIGVKLGDVNYDWNAAVAKGITNDNLQLIIDNKKMSIVNNQLSIPITASNFKDLVGLQYTLHFDNDKYEFVGIKGNKLGIEYNATKANQTGNISFVWTDAKAEEKTLEDGSELFELVLKKANHQSTIDNSFIDELSTIGYGLALNNSITDIEAWDKDFNKHSIVLKSKAENQNLKIDDEIFSVSPNPTTDGVVKVNMLSKANKFVVFELSNAYGKILLQQSFGVVKGNNICSINLNNNGKLIKGLYFIKVVGLTNNPVLKIVVE